MRHSHSSSQVASVRRLVSSKAASARWSSSTAAHTSRTVRAVPVTGIPNRRVSSRKLERKRLVIPDARCDDAADMAWHRHVDDAEGSVALRVPRDGPLSGATSIRPIHRETRGHRSRLPRRGRAWQPVHARMNAFPLADPKSMIDRPLASAAGDHLRSTEHAVLCPRQLRRDDVDFAHVHFPCCFRRASPTCHVGNARRNGDRRGGRVR